MNAPGAPAVNPYGPQAYAAAVSPQRTCRACRLDNPPANTICRGCGSAMPRGDMLPAPPAQPAAHAWGCPQCRAENAGHYEFCLGCGAARRDGGGAPVERSNVYNGSPATSAPKSPVVLIVVIVVVVIIVIGAALAGVAAMFLAR